MHTHSKHTRTQHQLTRTCYSSALAQGLSTLVCVCARAMCFCVYIFSRMLCAGYGVSAACVMVRGQLTMVIVSIRKARDHNNNASNRSGCAAPLLSSPVLFVVVMRSSCVLSCVHCCFVVLLLAVVPQSHEAYTQPFRTRALSACSLCVSHLRVFSCSAGSGHVMGYGAQHVHGPPPGLFVCLFASLYLCLSALP